MLLSKKPIGLFVMKECGFTLVAKTLDTKIHSLALVPVYWVVSLKRLIYNA
jgi:hypothetical protein